MRGFVFRHEGGRKQESERRGSLSGADSSIWSNFACVQQWRRESVGHLCIYLRRRLVKIESSAGYCLSSSILKPTRRANIQHSFFGQAFLSTCRRKAKIYQQFDPRGTKENQPPFTKLREASSSAVAVLELLSLLGDLSVPPLSRAVLGVFLRHGLPPFC